MGGRSSKKSFTEWDLVQFSNVTGIPLPMVEKIHKDFASATGDDNKMDKREFRHLYKKMYINTQPSSLPSALPPLFGEGELNKLSDYVFETYDYDGAGFLTFEEFAEAYLMLTHREGMLANGVTFRDRFNYVLDQDNSSPGYITRAQAERVFNRLNKYNNWINAKDTSLMEWSKPASVNWESHWSNLDDKNDRVPKDKFVDYVTTSNDYKRHFDT